MSKEAGSNGIIKIKPSLLPFTWKGLILVALGLTISESSYLVEIPTTNAYATSFTLVLAGLSVIGLGILMILIGIIRRNMFTFQVADSYIAIQKQLLRRSVRRIPFSSLSDIEVSQSLFGRLVGFGNIIPISKSGYGLVHGVNPTENIVAEMINVPHPDKVASLIMSRASMMGNVNALS
ncbi:MAG TPA: PH domain-containing protein [archaeon]|nr:PH domain-containing protein [archaeon]